MNSYHLGTEEYVKVTVSADRPLDTQSIWISVDNGNTWLPAGWLGSVANSRSARTSDPVTFGARYNGPLLVKINDNPEIPIIKAGSIDVK